MKTININNLNNMTNHIFLDVDDTIMDSSQAVLNQLNEKYGTNFNSSQVTSWDYTNLFPNISHQEIHDIFDSERFFSDVKFYNGAEEFIKNNLDRITFVTAGTDINLRLKKNFLKNNFGKIKFIGLPTLDKSNVNMYNSIQIDDNAKSLMNTNSRYKVLFTNHGLTDWNKDFYSTVIINDENFIPIMNYEKFDMTGWKNE